MSSTVPPLLLRRKIPCHDDEDPAVEAIAAENPESHPPTLPGDSAKQRSGDVGKQHSSYRSRSEIPHADGGGCRCGRLGDGPPEDADARWCEGGRQYARWRYLGWVGNEGCLARILGPMRGLFLFVEGDFRTLPPSAWEALHARFRATKIQREEKPDAEHADAPVDTTSQPAESQDPDAKLHYTFIKLQYSSFRPH